MKDLIDIIKNVVAAFNYKSLEVFRCHQLICYDGVQPMESLSSGYDEGGYSILEWDRAYRY